MSRRGMLMAALALVAACTHERDVRDGGIDGGVDDGGIDDGGIDDGGSSGAALDLAGRPIGDATVPTFGETCASGWCWENPLFAGPIDAVWVAGPRDVWLSTPATMLHYDGTTTTATGPGQVTFLAGTSPDDIWARQGALLLHYDGSSWSAAGPPSQYAALVAARAANDAWLVGSNGAPTLFHFDGASWSPLSLPPELTQTSDTQVQIDAIDVTADDHLWMTAFVQSTTTSMAPKAIVLRFDGASWTSRDVATIASQPAAASQPATVRAFSDSDVWLGSAYTLAHFDGSAWIEQPGGAADRLAGPTSDDLWAASYDSFSHWDGFVWKRVGALGAPPTSFSAGVRDEVWATAAADSNGGDLFFNAADGWNKLTMNALRGDLAQVVAAPVAAGGVDVWARGYVSEGASYDYVAHRDAAGHWAVDTRVSANRQDLIGMSARASDDLWLFGVKNYHYDGSTWLFTHAASGSDPMLLDLCSFDGANAFGAAQSAALWRWDGAHWSPDNGVGSKLFCLDGGDVWASGSGTLAHRVAGAWQTTVPANAWTTFYSPARGDAWAAAGPSLSHLSAGEWHTVDASALASLGGMPAYFTDVTGTSPTDISVIVQPTAAGASTVAHDDGSAWDATIAPPTATPLRWIRALAPNDFIVVGQHFETFRYRSGTWTTLFAGFGGATDPYAPPNGSGQLWLASASGGFAIDGHGWLLRFDGSSWTVDQTCPLATASDFRAFAIDDLWAVGDIGVVAHLNSGNWTTTTLTGATNGVQRIWGASGADLWVTRNNTIFRNVSGAFVAVALSPGLDPYESLSGTAADDVWLAGTYFDGCDPGATAAYRWDGNALALFRTPVGAIQTMRNLDGDILAAAPAQSCPIVYGVWQQTATGWLPRPDLDVKTTFPDYFRTISPAPPIAGPYSLAGSAPTWAVGPGAVIVRHQ